MEEQNQNQEYKPQETTETETTPEKKQTGSIIGSIIVIIVIIIGGLYFWGTRTNDTNSGSPEEGTIDPIAEPSAEDPIGDALNKTSNSDELDNIEADLNATNIDSVDGDINSVQQ